MREDRCVDLLRWNDNNFKELGRKLKFRAKIGQKMSQKRGNNGEKFKRKIFLVKIGARKNGFLKPKLGQKWHKKHNSQVKC